MPTNQLPLLMKPEPADEKAEISQPRASKSPQASKIARTRNSKTSMSSHVTKRVTTRNPERSRTPFNRASDQLKRTDHFNLPSEGMRASQHENTNSSAVNKTKKRPEQGRPSHPEKRQVLVVPAKAIRRSDITTRKGGNISPEPKQVVATEQPQKPTQTPPAPSMSSEPDVLFTMQAASSATVREEPIEIYER